MTEFSDPFTVGAKVLVLTRGYHWVGEIAAITALSVVLVKATCFVDIGQLDNAFIGKWDADAHGRQVPLRQAVSLFRSSADLIEWPHALPTKAIG
jgi:hypothetical protein